MAATLKLTHKAIGDLLRALADPERLRLLRHLIDEPRGAAELAALAGINEFEVRHQLDRLEIIGILTIDRTAQDARYSVNADARPPLLEVLGAASRPATDPSQAPKPKALAAVPH